MSSVRALALAFALALSACSAVTASPDYFVRGPADEEDRVIAQAQALIQGLDAGAYGRAWDQASTLFQTQTPRSPFVTGMASLRGRWGDPGARSVRAVGFSATVKGAPPGAYAAVLFATAFAQGIEAEEKLIVTLQDGQWRLAGYFIRTRPEMPARANP